MERGRDFEQPFSRDRSCHVASYKLSCFVRKHNLLSYICSECGNIGKHNGKPLVLQMDHINGVGDDNRLENLRFLCPNCHTQTSNFAGKARRKKPNVCPCGKEILSKTGTMFCSRVCAQAHQRRRPTKVPYTTLCARYAELQNYSAVARELGVSYTTVKNAVLLNTKSPIPTMSDDTQ